MSPRFPPLAPEAQTPFQKEIHAIMDRTRASLGNTQVFAGKNAAGALTGPFAVFMYALTIPLNPDWSCRGLTPIDSRAPPPVAKPLVDLGNTVVDNPQLSVRERQICVLAVCSVYRADFMTYAHIRIGKEAGFTADQVYDARIGKTPDGLAPKEQAAYEFSRAMAAAREVVPDDLFYRWMEVLGEEKITGLMHCVGLYVYTSLIMHISDVPIPDGGKIEK